jgi:hypothetical protein
MCRIEKRIDIKLKTPSLSNQSEIQNKFLTHFYILNKKKFIKSYSEFYKNVNQKTSRRFNQTQG